LNQRSILRRSSLSKAWRFSCVDTSIYDALPLPAADCVEELDACFVVKDEAGQKLAYVYYEEEPGRRDQLPSCSRKMRRVSSGNFAMLTATFQRARRVASSSFEVTQGQRHDDET